MMNCITQQDLGIVSAIAPCITTLVALFGVLTYYKQQKINRIQNSIAIFRYWANNDDFMKIFTYCDTIFSETDPIINNKAFVDLRDFAPEQKYKYLALLSEIVFYSKSSQVIEEGIFGLFGFHFYYVYYGKSSDAFWNNVGSGKDEKNKKGWGYQRDFAEKCEKIINPHKQ
jgi:hypothetical protein